ncbi:MAG: Unknown protein [uncultured Sulfurovum sp.]|uniref:EpsG family protein n=1 Tax=uncultured Sulfurovum sp. TaxID=269237 RepID=A0A6S6TGQ7_9BACT|nr:MAG: Unknown protein [uncultured Sulfurovum sp.]
MHLVQNNYLNTLLALIYATFFVYVIPWVEIYGSEFQDIPNYLNRIIYLKNGGDEAEFWGLSWLLSEPLWKEMILAIGYLFEDYRQVIYGISFFVTFVYASFLFKRVEFYIAMIFLFNPMMVHLFMEQIRIAFAFTLLLIAYDLFEKQKKISFLLMLLLVMAPLIHAAILVFYAVYYLLDNLNKKVEDKKYYLIAIGTALFIALFMKYGSNIILMFAGDRRANYGEVIEASSLSYSIAWFIIALIIATFAEFKESQNRVVVAYAITFMTFFFFSSILGMFAARYVAVIMPLIIISIAYLPKHFKQGTYLFLLAYNIFSFKYWLKLTIL